MPPVENRYVLLVPWPHVQGKPKHSCTLPCLSFFSFLIFVAPGLHCCVQAFSSCSEWDLLFVLGLLIEVASLVAEDGLEVHRLSSCAAQALADPWQVGSSGTRDWTRVPCIGRWTPIHCTTREVLTFKHFSPLIAEHFLETSWWYINRAQDPISAVFHFRVLQGIPQNFLERNNSKWIFGIHFDLK